VHVLRFDSRLTEPHARAPTELAAQAARSISQVFATQQQKVDETERLCLDLWQSWNLDLYSHGTLFSKKHIYRILIVDVSQFNESFPGHSADK
jgi:hypothetical protein